MTAAVPDMIPKNWNFLHLKIHLKKKQWNGNSVSCPILTVVWFLLLLTPFLSNFFSASGDYSSCKTPFNLFLDNPPAWCFFWIIPCFMLHYKKREYLEAWYAVWIAQPSCGSAALILMLRKIRKSSTNLNIDTHKALELTIPLTVKGLRLLFSIPLLLIFLWLNFSI